MISYALEYTLSEVANSFNILRPSEKTEEILAIPLEDVGTSYTQSDFEDDNFSYSILMDLKRQLSDMSLSTRGYTQNSDDDAFKSTCL